MHTRRTRRPATIIPIIELHSCYIKTEKSTNYSIVIVILVERDDKYFLRTS